MTSDVNKLTLSATRRLTKRPVNSVRTIQAKSVEKIARAAAARGVNTAELYRAVGFEPGVLSDPDARIPFAQLVALYEQAAVLTADDSFGLHMGEHVDATVFDVLGYAVI